MKEFERRFKDEHFEDDTLREIAVIASEVCDGFDGRAHIEGFVGYEDINAQADGPFSPAFVVKVTDAAIEDSVHDALRAAFAQRFPPDFLGNDVWWWIDTPEGRDVVLGN